MEEVRFCAWCGKIVNLKFHYCPWCGKNLFKEDSPGETVDRVVKEMSIVQTYDRISTLEKMEDQLGNLEAEINDILEKRG